VKRFPADAALRLALGIACESLGHMAPRLITSSTDLKALRREVEAYLEEAAVHLRGSLTADDTAAEGRVRLAHVYIVRGRDADAAALLDRVLALAPDAAWEYVARLMRGGVAERAGRPVEAAALYRAAIASHPDAQAAYVALAHLQYREGERAQASDTLDRVLTRPRSPEPLDPWWVYAAGAPERGTSMVQRLRDEIRDEERR
jgi:Tfp pilus assembly protein PilF